MIDVTCPQCNAVYHSDQTHIGKRIRCTRCGYFLQITDGKPTPIVAVQAQRVQPKVRSGAIPPANTPARLRLRWLYVGALLIMLGVLSVWIIQYQSGVHEAKPDHVSDQEAPNAAKGSSPDGNIFDELAAESASKIAHHPRSALSRSHEDAPKPDPRPPHYNSLPTGTRISEDVGTNGYGELTISNRTNSDAVVRLFETSSLKTVRWFFVQADSRCTVGAIPEGSYTLVYTSGLDWIDAEDGFRLNPSYHQFDRSVTYSEHTDEDGVQYHEISVTLHPVVGGNVRTRKISREEFLRGHRHMPLQKSQSQPVF